MKWYNILETWIGGIIVNSRQRKIVKQKKKYSLLVALVILFAVLLGIISIAKAFTPVKSIEYQVVKGDTLWAIAKSYKDKDLEDVLYDIYRINRLTNGDYLQPGQTLLLPIYD